MRTMPAVFATALALTACATVPRGPSVLVLPGTGKTFEAFQVDHAVCRDWAAQQVGASPEQVAGQSVGVGAAVGTAVGATAGAALGAASGRPLAGAAVGAGVGALAGSAAGAERGRGSAESVQTRYDNAYVQCMYANGNRIPVARGSYAGAVPPKARPAPQDIPPPPPGEPPPPPPGPAR